MATELMSAPQFPLGIILPYAGPTSDEDLRSIEKAGWYLCDGRAVSRKLPVFGVIGDLHGEADGVDHFCLPDYRGQFLRGVDNPRGNDPAGVDDENSRTAIRDDLRAQVGSRQSDQIQAHRHGVGFRPADGADYDGGGGARRVELVEISTTPFGGNETRPKNVYVNYLIFCGH